MSMMHTFYFEEVKGKKKTHLALLYLEAEKRLLKAFLCCTM